MSGTSIIAKFSMPLRKRIYKFEILAYMNATILSISETNAKSHQRTQFL